MNEIKKDLTTVKSGIVAHGCNCSGGFGSGIAGAIKNKWPAVAIEFRGNGRGAELLGTVQRVQLAEDLFVVNCYTQEFYGPGDKRYADPEAIEECLYQLLEMAIQNDDLDLYIAKMGCGLGGLSWEHEVKEIYESVFADAGVNVYVCDI
jgi:O-acetyl-ADP-ribose deacetylase (regulator of RNase III)